MIEDITGRVVIMKDLDYPDESEHSFMFVWVMSVNDHRLQVIEYSQSTDLCGELVDGTGPEWVDRVRVFSNSFTWDKFSRNS